MLIFEVPIILMTIYFSVVILYISVLSVAGLFYKEKKSGQEVDSSFKTAILIPAYKEDGVIVNVAKKAIDLKYKGLKDVVVIADSLKPETLAILSSLDLKLIQVSFEKSTKSKALNAALSQLSDDYDMAVVLDADNVLHEDALDLLAADIQNGYVAVQGHRCAKNLENGVALLDAISEEVNNHIYSKGPQIFKWSSRLAGSGMAFDYGVFKDKMSQAQAVGGFDKELELMYLSDERFIKYNDKALVFDEKVSHSVVYQKQRTRWISSQYFYLRKSIENLSRAFAQRNLDYIQKVIQYALPPRLLIPSFSYAVSVLFLLIGFADWSVIWSVLSVLITIAYAIAIPRKFYQKELLKAFVKLPSVMLSTIKALFKLKGANKTFIHTPHLNKK